MALLIIWEDGLAILRTGEKMAGNTKDLGVGIGSIKNWEREGWYY